MRKHFRSAAGRAAIAKANAINKRRYPIEYGYMTRLHRIWKSMHFRCYQKSHEAYARYAGRGITVCDEWHDYANFIAWAVSAGYQDTLQIDRIDNERGYSPENCRWVTARQQQQNRRDTRMVTAFGETKCIKEWSRDSRCQVSYESLHRRIVEGADPELAIVTPPVHTAGHSTFWQKAK